jgi:hypothetical protein
MGEPSKPGRLRKILLAMYNIRGDDHVGQNGCAEVDDEGRANCVDLERAKRL